MVYYISIGTQETYEALSQFLFMEKYYMKEYKHNEELIEHLKNKNVIIDDENTALNIIDNY